MFLSQPDGPVGARQQLSVPMIYNLRRDPFERYANTNLATGSSDFMMSFYMREFWRFVYVQQKVAELAKSVIEYPPMQKGASFNMDAVKAQVEKAMAGHAGS